MPYLTNNFKREVNTDGALTQLAEYLATLTFKDFLGALNYTIYRIVVTWFDSNEKTYQSLCSIAGTIDCSKAEIYRRITSPYEDTKLKENGDV